MYAAINKRTILIGIVDGLVVFALPILLYVLSGKQIIDGIEKLITLFWLHVLFVLLPFSVFAGWRGKLDAERLLKGNRLFIRPVVEGFIVGFTLIVLISAFGLASEALASGGIYDNVLYDPWSIKNWVELIGFILQMGAIVGGVGAIVGFGLNVLNRLLLKSLRAI